MECHHTPRPRPWRWRRHDPPIPKLAEQKIGTLRFNFAYMEKGGAPDRPKKAHPAIIEAVKKAKKYSEGLT